MQMHTCETLLKTPWSTFLVPISKLLTTQMISQMKPSHSNEHHLRLISKTDAPKLWLKTIGQALSIAVLTQLVSSFKAIWPAFLPLRNTLIRAFSNTVVAHPDDIYCLSSANPRETQTDCFNRSYRTPRRKEKGRNILSASPPSPCNFNSSSFWSAPVNYSCTRTRWEVVTGGI